MCNSLAWDKTMQKAFARENLFPHFSLAQSIAHTPGDSYYIEIA
jgi:hypothetical protein